MRISTKLRLVAALPFLVLLTAVVTQYRANAAMERLYGRRAIVGELQRVITNQVSLTYEYGITRGERAATQWHNQYSEAERTLADAVPVFGSRHAVQFEELRQGLLKTGRLFSDLHTYDISRPSQGVTMLATEIRNNMVNRLILELQSVAPLIDALRTEIDEDMQRAIRQGALLTIGILLILALCLFGLAFWVTGGIRRSLQRFREGIQTVAGGDLRFRVCLDSGDELGELARGFDEMTERLALITVSHGELAREMEERRLAEEASRLSETKYRLLFENMTTGFALHEMMYDTEGHPVTYRFLEVNQAFEEITGLAASDLIGRTVREVMPETEQFWLDIYGKIARTGEPASFQNYSRELDRYFDVWAFSVSRDKFAVIFSDVTGRKKAEEQVLKLNEELESRVATRTRELAGKTREVEETQNALVNIVEDLNVKTLELEAANVKLQEVDRLKSMFIASMSHELRTPLNSIIGFSSIVLGEWMGPLNEQQKEKLAIVLRTGKHLLALINDLIDISKIEAGKLESVSEEFDLFDLLTEAAGIVEADIKAKGLILAVEAIHQPMIADRRRLYQCVVNLLGNAVKFSRAGTVTLRAAPVRDAARLAGAEKVAICIRDTGIGIREEDLPKLFISFVRLKLPEDMQAKGTGLGLYLVKKIATEILHGSVSVTSVYGEGSEFCLTVPVKT